MYFKEKENTNIDSEFENNKNINLKNLNLKTKLLIAGGLTILIIIILISVLLIINSSKYTLELIGSEQITLTIGDDYIEPGYKAYDKKNNDYTSSVDITSNINTSIAGNYEIIYSIGKIQKIRYITVKEKVDATYIRLKGDINMYLEVGEKYIEPGYDAYDSIDQGLTNKVIVSGKIDTSRVGIYQLTYTVVNSRNVTITETRNVIVVAKGQKP